MEQGDFWALWGRPELKGWMEAQRSGVLERQDFCWDKKWDEESIQPQTYPQGSWCAEDTGFQQEVLSPTLSIGQKSEALGEFTPESGVGPLRYQTARNKQTSFCSQPGPPPCRIQDVCVSSSLLCLNTVCGMTCEGGRLRRRELGSLGSIPCLPSCFLLTGSPSSSLLPDQSLGLPHPSPFPLRPQEGPGAGCWQMLHSVTAGPTAPTLAPSSVSWRLDSGWEPLRDSFVHSILLEIGISLC